MKLEKIKQLDEEKKRKLAMYVALPLTVLIFLYAFVTRIVMDDAPAPVKKVEQTSSNDTEKKQPATKTKDKKDNKHTEQYAVTDSKISPFTSGTVPFIEQKDLNEMSKKKTDDKKDKTDDNITVPNDYLENEYLHNMTVAQEEARIRKSMEEHIISSDERKAMENASNPESGNPEDLNKGQSNVIQGIATGGFGGNIAIMGDGRIISEGDLLDGARVLSVDSSGIILDNGQVISYR